MCREFDLPVRYTVFPLHPETPDAGRSLEQLFGGRANIPAIMARLRRVAEELELPLGDRTNTYNSRRAQELGKWAEQQGQGRDFQEAVYKAYFVDGLNIAQAKVLTEIVASIGLDAVEAERVLIERSYADEVNADWQRARDLGVTAVPTVIYGNKRLVGFNPYAEYRQLVANHSSR